MEGLGITVIIMTIGSIIGFCYINHDMNKTDTGIRKPEKSRFFGLF